MTRDEVIQAYASLENDHAFAVIMDDLKSRREAARDAAEKSTDLLGIGRHQGASMLAGDMIALAQGAREAIAQRVAKRKAAEAARTASDHRHPQGL